LKNLFHRFRRNRRGFTLIELVTAFAILGLTAGAVGTFVVTGVRSYQKDHQVAAVQQEVQLGMNRIDRLVREASLGISYNVQSGSTASFVKSDAEAGVSNVTYKALYVFVWNDARNKVVAEIIRWSAASGKVEYIEKEITAADDETRVEDALSIGDITGWETLASGIESITFDLSRVESSGLVSYSMSAAKGRDTYEASNSVNLRNNALLNPETVGKLSSQAESVVETTITGLTMSAASGSIVRGGTTQLSTRVKGEGYPSQLIHRYTVEEVRDRNGDGMIGVEDANGIVTPSDGANAVFSTVYDSANASTTGTFVNSSTKLLTLSADSTATLLRVTAYVNAGTETYSASVYISVKEITSFLIRPARDASGNLTFLNYVTNKKLKEETQEYPASDTTESSPAIQVFAGNEVPMEAVMTGSNLNDKDRRVSWNIVSKSSEDVLVTVSSEGVIMVGQYTKSGYVLVNAYPYLDPSQVRSYRINVQSLEDDPDTALEITGTKSMNRGGKLQLGLSLNGLEVEDLTEYSWSVEVSGQTGKVTGTPASITSSGLLTVSTSLAYEYAYTVTVTAYAKAMPDVVAMATLRVPKVELKMGNSSLIGTIDSTKYTTIPASDLYCTVIGIDNAKVEWAVASASNPNYYNTSLANGTYLTASADTMSASLTISPKEPSDLAYFRVRASLKNYSSINAITFIPTDSDSVSFVIASDGSVKRGESLNLTATFLAGGNGISTNTTRWSLVGVKLGDETLTTTGIKLSSEWGSSVKLSVDRKYKLSDKNISITVRAEFSGLTAESVITITPEAGTKIVTSAATVARGGCVSLTTDPLWDGLDVKWTVVEASGGSTSIKGVTLSSSASSAGSGQTLTGGVVYLHVPQNAYVTESDVKIKVKAEIEGLSEMTATVAVKGLTVELTTNSGLTDETSTIKNPQYMGRGSEAIITMTTDYTGEVSWICSESGISMSYENNKRKCKTSVPLTHQTSATANINYTVTAVLTGDDGEKIEKTINYCLVPLKIKYKYNSTKWVTSKPTVNRGDSLDIILDGVSVSTTKTSWSVSVSAGTASTITKAYAKPNSSDQNDTVRITIPKDFYLSTQDITVSVKGTAKSNDGSVTIGSKTAKITIKKVSSGLDITLQEEELLPKAGASVHLSAAIASSVTGDLSKVQWSIETPVPGVVLTKTAGGATELKITEDYQAGVERTITVKALLDGLEAYCDVPIPGRYNVTISRATSDGTAKVLRGGTVTFSVVTNYPDLKASDWTVEAYVSGSSTPTVLTGTMNSDKSYTATLPANFDKDNKSGDYIIAKINITDGAGGSGESSQVEIAKVTMSVSSSTYNQYGVTVSGYASSVNLSFGISKNSSETSIPTGGACGLTLTKSGTTCSISSPNGVTECGPIYVYAEYAATGGNSAGPRVKSSALKIIGIPKSGLTDYSNSSWNNTAYYIPAVAFMIYLKQSKVDGSSVTYFKTAAERGTWNAIGNKFIKVHASDSDIWLAKDGSQWYYLKKNVVSGVTYYMPQTVSGSDKAKTYYSCCDYVLGGQIQMSELFGALLQFIGGNSAKYKLR